MDLDQILQAQIVNIKGVDHYVVNGLVLASFIPCLEATCKVNIELVYDTVWKDVPVSHTGPAVVVYRAAQPMNELLKAHPLMTLWTWGAINGLGFCGDLALFGWSQPRMLTCMSSESQMDWNQECQLARDLLLHRLKAEWDHELVSRSADAETATFIAKMMSRGEDL